MASAKPPRSPAFDATAFSSRLYERVLQANGKPYTVFRPKNDAGTLINFPRFANWLRNIRDVVNANALFLDEVKNDLDVHKAADNKRHATLENRVSALEAGGTPPFPG